MKEGKRWRGDRFVVNGDTVYSLFSVKKYLLIAQAELHPGSQNMGQNLPDTWTF